MALAIRVFPTPGSPSSSTPLGGLARPLNWVPSGSFRYVTTYKANSHQHRTHAMTTHTHIVTNMYEIDYIAACNYTTHFTELMSQCISNPTIHVYSQMLSHGPHGQAVRESATCSTMHGFTCCSLPTMESRPATSFRVTLVLPSL